MSGLNLRGSVNGPPSSRSLPPARPFLFEDEDGCCHVTGPSVSTPLSHGWISASGQQPASERVSLFKKRHRP